MPKLAPRYRLAALDLAIKLALGAIAGRILADAIINHITGV